MHATHVLDKLQHGECVRDGVGRPCLIVREPLAELEVGEGPRGNADKKGVALDDENLVLLEELVERVPLGEDLVPQRNIAVVLLADLLSFL